jgi:hypothetical protein
VLPGSLIHTNPDVKPIESIKEGDRVLGWDGRYHRVTEVFSHRHQGMMYKIRAKCLGEVTLTPEHPCSSQDELTRSDTMRSSS